MISVCIPIYNYDVAPLVKAILKQCGRVDSHCEIILIDDGSSEDYREKNRALNAYATYIELPENVGRAKIRNLFLNYANCEYLLFLDCDSLVGSADYVANFMAIVAQKPDVVCGGRVFYTQQPDTDSLLRWKYGRGRESKSFEMRSQNPNRSFMTNNFMIRKSLLNEIRFDERLKKYGHEDTLFGISLMQHNIVITHINNPVINGDNETNSVYLFKTKQGIENLVQIAHFNTQNNMLWSEVTLLRVYRKFAWAKGLLAFSFPLGQTIFTQLLKHGIISLQFFDVYKITYLARCFGRK